MKDLIRKILHEAIQIGPDAPDWVEKFHDLPKEERIEFIKNYKERIERILPKIIEFFNVKFGDELVKIEVEEKGSHYGNEGFSIKKPSLQFYFNFTEKERYMDWGRLHKREIYNDLKSYFNIDVAYYGTPLEFEIYKMMWEKV
jgi:hypothetical protein